PLVSLLATLTQARSSAVRGDLLDVGEVRGAVAEVEKANDKLGADLHAEARWQTLEKQIDGVLEAKLTGAAAYQGYAEPITAVRALINKIGDTSNLVLDPNMVTYYLADVAMVRLPEVLVSASQVLDLTYLAGDDPDFAATTQIAVARREVGQAAGAVNSGIHKSVDAAEDDRIGRGLVGDLDAFRIAATEIAPVNVLDPANSGLDVTTEFADAQRLHRSAMRLATMAFAELAGLLNDRQGRYTSRNVALYTAGTLVVIAAAGLTWQLFTRRHHDA
ncbi:MAG: hypothetical protein HOQ05_09525, partial [Corynebacteriales bacterium]|nr:hypothetical protein [Mycobacteriales bacterium]